jgi:hypothetical protein
MGSGVNVDFANHPGFSAYVLLLMFSGLAMVVVGSPVIRSQRPLTRVLNVGFGLAFFGYGFYLAFLFQGGHYVIFFKAFVLPVVLIVRSISGARRRQVTANPIAGYPPAGAPHAQWSAPAAPQTAWNAPHAQWSAPAAPQAPWSAPAAQEPSGPPPSA